MKHKYKSHKSIRKLKNKKHQILCSLNVVIQGIRILVKKTVYQKVGVKYILKTTTQKE